LPRTPPGGCNRVMSEPSPSPSPVLVVALVRDLLLASRITTAAREVGVPLRIVRDPAVLAPETEAPLVLVDLNLAGALESAATWKSSAPDRRVVGFVSHVDGATVNRAREAGLSEVLARSRFFEALETLLRGHVRGTT